MVQLDADNASTELPPESAFDDSVRRGTRWVFLAQVASQLISFALLAALYRLVAPDEFGLLGMAVPWLLLAKTLASFGLHVATIQQPRLTTQQLSTVFWASLSVSAAITLLVVAAAPLVAYCYQAPELSRVLAVLAGTLLLAAAGAQHQALLERKLQLGRVAALRLIAQAAGACAAVASAVAHWGVWALVVQQYVELSALAALAWWSEPWRPCRWRRAESARALLEFGGLYATSGLLFFVAQSADKILLGWFLGATQAGQVAVGFYSQAFNLMMKPVYLVSAPLTGVMLPALSRSVAQPARFATLVARFYRLVAIALFPCGAGLAVVGVDLVVVLGGAPWRGAGVLLMLLAPVVAVQGLINICGSVLAAAGRGRALLGGALVMTLWLVACCALGLWLGHRASSTPGGASYGVAVGFTAGTLLVALPYCAVCLRAVGVAPGAVLLPLWRPAVHAVLMGLLVAAVATPVKHWQVEAPVRLAVTVPLGVLSYLLLARREASWLVAQLRRADRGDSHP